MTLHSGLTICHAIAIAALMLNSFERITADRDQVSCFYCVPDSTNNFCASIDKVTQQIDCPAGRCLVMGAKLSATGKTARFYTCDTHNIIDWGFQILRYPADKVDPNNCGWLETKDDEAITMLREYGLQGDVQKLLQGTLPSSGAAVSAVTEQMEICTCEGKLCNSPDAQIKWTLLPASGDSSSLQPRRGDYGTKNEYYGREKVPSVSPRLMPRVGLDEKDRERMDSYMNNLGEGRREEKPTFMDKEYPRGHEGQVHPHHAHDRLIEARSSNTSPRRDGGFGDGWWYWVVIVISILLVLGALYLLYRIASSPAYATNAFERTTDTHTSERVEGVPLRHQRRHD